MKKKVVSSLLCVAMVASLLVGCGSKPADTAAPAGDAAAATDAAAPAADGETVHLTVAARGGSHTDVIEAAKAQFEKDNNCTIEVLGLEAADLKQKVALDATNKEGAYDLVMIDDPVMPEFIDAGVLLDLTQAGYTDDTDFVEKSLALGKGPYATGDTYALPFTGNVVLMFYNQEVLDGLGKEVPTTWADVLDVATAANKEGKAGYVIRGQQGNPIVGDYLPLLWAYGGDVFDKDWNVTVDSPEAKAALQMYCDLLAVGANYEKDDIIGAVKDGNGAMALGWPSWFISGDGAAAAYAPIPAKVDANSEAKATGTIGNWMMGVTANSTHQELAMKLLEYLTSADVQKAAVDNGGVPTRTSVFEDADILAKYPYFATIEEATANSVVRPRTAKWSNIEDVYGTELSNVVAGVKDIDSALADAKTAIEDIMK